MRLRVKPTRAQIEWIEWGWPLRADGRCDTRSASEVGLVGMSAGLRELPRAVRDKIFPASGGSGARWNAAGTGPVHDPHWPHNFPGAIVLREEPQLSRTSLGRGLVLALVEQRLEPNGRPFIRCLWFILPFARPTLDELPRFAACCQALLSHRGSRNDDAPIELEPRPAPKPLALRGALPSLRASMPAPPVELMVSLYVHTCDHWTPDIAKRGLALCCRPVVAEHFGAALPAHAELFSSQWRSPLSPARSGESLSSAPRPSQSMTAMTPPSDRPTHGLQTPIAIVLLIALLAIEFVEVGLLGASLGRDLVPSTSELDADDLSAVATSEPGSDVAAALASEVEPDTSANPAISPAPASAPASSDSSAAPPRFVPALLETGEPALFLPRVLERESSEIGPELLGFVERLSEDGALTVVGLSTNESCELADQFASLSATVTARLFEAKKLQVEMLVVGRRPIGREGLLLTDGIPLDGALLLSSSQRGRWAELAKPAECEDAPKNKRRGKSKPNSSTDESVTPKPAAAPRTPTAGGGGQ